MPYKNIEEARACNRTSYHRNKRARMARILAYKEECKLKIRKIKEESPCTDCGQYFPYCVMDFDHVSDNKDFNVSVGMWCTGWQKVLKEIEKCDIVCANCHRLRTRARHLTD